MMEFSYFSGFILAFVIGLVKVAISFSNLLSIRARNLAKVGQHYNCFQGRFVEQKSGKGSHLFFVIYMLVLAPLFSWLSVMSAAWTFVAAWSNKVPVPEKIKEIQFKIASIDLSKEQLAEMYQEIAVFYGVNNPISALQNSDEDSDRFTLVIETGDWPREITVDPKSKTYVYYSRTPDYDSVFNSKFEYKIENLELWQRELEDSVDHYGKIEYDIKDNVVLEYEIRKRHEESSFKIVDLEEKLQRLNNSVKWHRVEAHNVTLFIFSHHPDLISAFDFRKFVRSEWERLKIAVVKINKAVTELGGNVVETEFGFEPRYGESQSEEQKEALSKIFEQDMKVKFGASSAEHRNFKSIESEFRKWLGEKSEATKESA